MLVRLFTIPHIHAESQCPISKNISTGMLKLKKKSIIAILMTVVVGIASDGVYADVTGFVREQGTLNPIAGALVTQQATQFRNKTANDGSFTLLAPDGLEIVIVGAGKGYYNQSVVVDSPLSGVEILLELVPQGDDSSYSFMSPGTCRMCHPDQYDQWLGTPMAQAGFNTWVDDIYSGLGTPNGIGGFVYLRDSVFAEENPASECAACHQPEPWVENPFSPLEDPLDSPSLGVSHGISCDICHKIADVDVSKINYPGVFPDVLTYTRPQGPSYLQVAYGVLGDVDYKNPSLMRSSYQPQLLAEVCGACHQDKNDLDGDHSFTGVTSEPTYIEWVESPYGDIESPLYKNCVDCHMPPSGATEVCQVLYPPLIRDPNTIRSHKIEGTTPFYLENAVDMDMQTSVNGREIAVEVSIVNSLTGHHVPTGVTVRNMILVVEAWPAGGDPLINALSESGTQTVHHLGGVGDPGQGYFAGLPGKFYGKVNHDASGNGPTFFTDATGIEFDTRIPALSTDTTNYRFSIPPVGGDFHVRARLVYRRAFRFLVDAKQWTHDGHGNPLEDIAAPDFGHLMEMSEITISANSVPAGACCLSNETCDTLDQQTCHLQGGTYLGDETVCGSDVDHDTILDCQDQCPGIDDRIDLDKDNIPDCIGSGRIPTVSQWGLVIMLLLLLTLAKVNLIIQRSSTE